MYCDITFAINYFATRLESDYWDTASTTDRIAALTMATEAIDRLNFIGEKADENQTSQFPRGADIDVPDDIKKANAEIALELLKGRDSDAEYMGLFTTGQSFVNVRTTYDRRSAPPHLINGILSVVAWRYIKPYLLSDSSIKIG